MSATANLAQSDSWMESLNHKVKAIYSEIAAIQRWIEEAGGDEELFDSLTAPYTEMLKKIYEEDFALAHAIQHSDLLVRLEGPAVSVENPRLSLITGLFTQVRKQVGDVAKSIAGILEETTRIPKEMDLGLSAFARGSLFLGFTLPSPEQLDKKGQISVLGEEDPLYKAAKNAIRTLGVITHHINIGSTEQEIAKDVPDPMIRDTALIAIHRLAPSGRKDITAVGIGGREMDEFYPRVLTKETRKELKERLKHPVKSTEVETFTGTVREIDLDARRFELRHIHEEALNDMRCAYSSDYKDNEAKAWLNQTIRVTGLVERLRSGRPKLLELNKIEIS